jgi:hypothetical protein
VKYEKYERGGRQKVNIIFRFTEPSHELLHLEKIKFGAVEDHRHTCEFYLNLILFDETFKYGGGAKF